MENAREESGANGVPCADVTPGRAAGVSARVEDEDATLVRRAVAGDERAFERLVDRHYPRCLRYAWRQLGSRADAEEAVQDTFVRVYRSLASVSPGRVRQWITSILVNRCRTYGRRLRAVPPAGSIDAVAGLAAAVAPPRIEAEDLDGTPVGRALASLSPLLRETFLLKHVEELTHEEIAALTGASVSAVKMRVKRAGEKLAEALEGEDG